MPDIGPQGFLRMGGKLFAVPWKALTLVQEEEHSFLDVDKKVLENDRAARGPDEERS